MSHVRRYRIPGRVELVGKHVDYGGGRSLTCATEFALGVRAVELPEASLRLRSRSRPAAVTLPLDANVQAPPGHWSAYAAAVVRRLKRDFPELRHGVELEIDSTLPESAGLSSSSALVVATALALIDANRLRESALWHTVLPDNLAEAEYCGAMESGAPFGPFAGDEGVGTRGGAQDHVAILCARAGEVGQFAYLPARREGHAPWPDTHVLAIAVSGVEATKTANALTAFNRLSDALRADGFAADGVSPATEAAGIARRAQFREETLEIVPGVFAALEAHDWAAMGRWVDRSQHLAETALRNQVPETIALHRIAREGGALAASAFGAGFGGAIWAMVEKQQAQEFQQRWRERYLARFPQHAARCRLFVTSPAGPASRLDP